MNLALVDEFEIILESCYYLCLAGVTRSRDQEAGTAGDYMYDFFSLVPNSNSQLKRVCYWLSISLIVIKTMNTAPLWALKTHLLKASSSALR